MPTSTKLLCTCSLFSYFENLFGQKNPSSRGKTRVGSWKTDYVQKNRNSNGKQQCRPRQNLYEHFHFSHTFNTCSDRKTPVRTEKLELDRENSTTFWKTVIRTKSHNADLDKTFMHMFTFLILLTPIQAKKPQFERKNSSWIRKTRRRSEKP